MIIQKNYINENGVETDLLETTTDDETKVLIQVETGCLYDKAIDKKPCKFTYQEIDKPEEEEKGEE